MSERVAGGAGSGRVEPRGTLRVNLVRGRDIPPSGDALPCLYVKIRVGSDTTWTPQPAHSYLAPEFGMRFTGFNVRASTEVEFQVVNRTPKGDVTLSRGAYPVKSLSSTSQTVFVPLLQGGFLEAEMAYDLSPTGTPRAVRPHPMAVQYPAVYPAPMAGAFPMYPMPVAVPPGANLPYPPQMYPGMVQMQPPGVPYPRMYPVYPVNRPDPIPRYPGFK